MGRIVVEQFVEAPVEKVFPFFAESRNFATLLPEEANFECDELTSGEVGLGSKRRIRVNAGGRRMEQVMETVEFVENRRQVDRQVEGDMMKFEKTGIFDSIDGGTKLTWIVDYEMPYSVLGKILDVLMVRRQITAYLQGALDRGKAIFERTQGFSVPAPDREPEAA